MAHWTPQGSRGDYDRPELNPPQVRPRESNDLGSRMTRTEEHLNWTARDRQRLDRELLRVERDSLNRDHDLADSITGLQQIVNRWNAKVQAAQLAWVWTGSVVKWSAGIVLIFAAFYRDGAAAGINLVLGALGLPKL